MKFRCERKNTETDAFPLSVEKCDDESTTRRRKKKKSGGGARRFLDLEAVRDSDTSADEDDDGGEDEDKYEASFVDDHDHTSGERSMYLKAAAGIRYFVSNDTRRGESTLDIAGF